jgi:carbohydrate diacid regulator
MINLQIAEKIQLKVTSLVNQPVTVTDEHGIVLATNQPGIPASLDISDSPRLIEFNYAGKVAGYVALPAAMPNHTELAPLIRSIAELVMHQSILVEQIPRQEERLDKFIYDCLHHNPSDEALVIAEARLFDIDLERPRIAIVITIDDPVLTTVIRTPSSDRETRITRYKSGITRGLNSFYTASRNNLVAYIGENRFCILKDLLADNTSLEHSVDNFKKSITTTYEIIRSETKLPTTIGIGNYHEGLAGLKQSYEEAVSAIELGSQLWEQNRVYHIDDFGVVAPLLSGIDENNIYFSRDLLDKLGENSEIIQTLQAFFNNNMSLTQTADELGIHRNTLVYRLDRINETLGLDPRNFDDAVQIKLAILFTHFIESDYVYKS